MFKNYFRINKAYLAEMQNLEEDLIKANAIIEEQRVTIDKQINALIDLTVANSSVELIGTTLESREFEIVKWQNKYIDLVNRSLDKVPVIREDDRVEAGEEVDKEPINQRTPWHVRRRQLEQADRIAADRLRAEARDALSKPPSVAVLSQAAQELESEFNAGEQS